MIAIAALATARTLNNGGRWASENEGTPAKAKKSFASVRVFTNRNKKMVLLLNRVVYATSRAGDVAAKKY